MKKRMRFWLVTAAILTILGGMIFVTAGCKLGWNLNTGYVTKTYDVMEDFDGISIDTDTEDIFLYPSEAGYGKVVCFTNEKIVPVVTVEDGTLTIKTVDERKWYEHIGIFAVPSEINIYLPKDEYRALVIQERTGEIKVPQNFKFESVDIKVSTGSVECYAITSELMKIKTTTGRIRVGDTMVGALHLTASTGKVQVSSVVSVGDIEIYVSTGDVKMTNVTCKNLITEGSTGDIDMENVVAVEKFSIERSTGEVEFERCDAAEIFIVTDTGNVEGSLLSDKEFFVDSSTGRVRVPKETKGGRCEITTATGDIEIEIE